MVADLDKEVQLGPIDVTVGDVELGAVELKDGASDNRASIDPSGNLSSKIFDKDGNGLTSTDEGGGVRSLDVSVKSGVTTYEVVGIKDSVNVRIDPAKEGGNLLAIKNATEIIDDIVDSAEGMARVDSPSLLVDDMESDAAWSLRGTGSNKIQSTNHLIGQYAVGFDKAATGVRAGISRVLSSLDIGAHAAHYVCRFSIYLSSLADISKVYIKLGKDVSNYREYTKDVGDLQVGWNVIVWPFISAGSSQLGTGFNTGDVDYIEIGIETLAAGDTLAGIAVDHILFIHLLDISVFSAPTFDIDLGKVAIKDGDSNAKLDVEADSSKNAAFVQSESLSKEASLVSVKNAVEILDNIVDTAEESARIDTPVVEIDAMEDHTDWALTGASANKADTVNHLHGQYAVEFDKTAGNVRAGISQTLAAINLTHPCRSNFRFYIYLSSLTNVDHIYLKAGTDSSNYREYQKDVGELQAGWNAVSWPITDINSVGTGNGLITGTLTFVEIGIEMNATGNTLADIAVDSLCNYHVLDTAVFSAPIPDVPLGVVRLQSSNTSVKLDIEPDSGKKAAWVQSQSLAKEAGNLAAILAAFNSESDYSTHLNPGSNPVLTLDTKGKPNVEVWTKSIAGSKTLKVYGSRDNSNFRLTAQIITDASTKEATKGWLSGYRYVRIELVETGTGTSELEISAQR